MQFDVKSRFAGRRVRRSGLSGSNQSAILSEGKEAGYFSRSEPENENKPVLLGPDYARIGEIV